MMCGKLTYSVSMVAVGFVLALGGVARATFDTVGVYDPDDDPHHNQVDQSGVYHSHTGNAGPKNVIDLAAFQALIGPAFDADSGGVVDAESGDLDGQDVIANFGVSGTKSVTFSSTGGTLHRGSGVASGNRQPTSGNARFSKSDNGDFVFDIGPVTGGVPGEAVTYFAGTLVYADHRDVNPQVTATFSGGGTVTAIADMPSGAPSNSLDTFFGFAAPRGESIVNVTFDLTAYTNLDDVAFITSAFVVVLKEASNPSPANGRTDVPRDVVLNWTPGEFASQHDVYLGTSFDVVNAATNLDPMGPDRVYRARQGVDSYAVGERLDFDQTYYWRIDEVNGPPDFTVHEGSVWSFTTELFAHPVENITATASSANQADMGPEKTTDNSGLDDNDLHSSEETDMWLSSTEPLGAWIQYEFDKVYKLHEMWVWNSNQTIELLVGFGVKDVTIEYSTNGTDYVTLGTTHEFARAPGADGYEHNTTIDLSGVAAKYVRLTANSNWGGIMPQYGLSEVRFFYIPVYAREPSPDSGATGIYIGTIDKPVDVTLGFRAGREAATHNVYFSADEQAVIDGTAAVATVTEASYGPLSLDLGKTYYWRVDEVNEAETPATWQGELWNFATQEYFVVDDFEAYNDLDPGDPNSNRVFLTWIDGWDQPTNGSVVGYENPPFCERTIVHGGRQSMPFFYDNSGTANYSEASLTLSSPQDWTKQDVRVLVLWFRGEPANTAAPMYVALNGSAVVYHDNPDAVLIDAWTEWNIELQGFADQGVNLANVNTVSIGFGDKTKPPAGGSGKMYFDDIRLRK